MLEGESIDLITELYKYNVLSFLFDWLNYNETDILKYCLKGIEYLLQYGNRMMNIHGYEANIVKEEIEKNQDIQLLINLQYSSVKSIYTLVEDIVRNYFENSDEINEA